MSLESTVFVTEQQANAVNATFATQQLRKAVAEKRKQAAEQAAASSKENASQSGGLASFFSKPLSSKLISNVPSSNKTKAVDEEPVIYF